MTAIDWIPLLQKHGVEYAERGANVKRGEVAVQCPFCASADPSKHMGINLQSGWWSCWRNKQQHSGKSPVRLLIQLLRVSYANALEIAGLDRTYVDPDGFDALAARLLYPNSVGAKQQAEVNAKHGQVLVLDNAFRSISAQGTTVHHWSYLFHDRGFDTPRQRSGRSDISKLEDDYSVRAGVSGAWSSRVILPYYEHERLVAWTARAIGTHPIRYKDLELSSCICAPKSTLYNHGNAAQGGKVLIVQEGPFDALKVDVYGRRYGVRSVALSTSSISTKQTYLLEELAQSFKRTIVVLDTKKRLGIVDSMRMKQQLAFLPSVEIAAVPFDAGDGGALTRQQVARWCDELTN